MMKVQEKMQDSTKNLLETLEAILMRMMRCMMVSRSLVDDHHDQKKAGPTLLWMMSTYSWMVWLVTSHADPLLVTRDLGQE